MLNRKNWKGLQKNGWLLLLCGLLILEPAFIHKDFSSRPAQHDGLAAAGYKISRMIGEDVPFRLVNRAERIIDLNAVPGGFIRREDRELLIGEALSAENPRSEKLIRQPGNPDASQNIDSLLNQLSLEEKIGQLLMLPVYSNRNESYYKDIELLIRQYHIGGLLFFQGSPRQQAELTNRFQELAKVRLFIAMDAEWGLGMRLDSITPFPRNMTLGAVQDTRLIYNVGAAIARQCRIMGVHINFAPVLDVNNNANNPVINIRSFGEDPELVTENGMAFIKGMQDNGIIAVGKHFPGHGDTDVDSHHSLPLITHDRNRLDSVELYPFRKAVQAGLKGIMVAHLNVPSLESNAGLPASLSVNIVQNLLVDQFQYHNLVFTDALNMQGVTSRYPEGKRELEAFRAGNDILVMPVNVPSVFKMFTSAISANIITENELTERVRKILSFKLEAGVLSGGGISTPHLTWRLNDRTDDLNYQVFEHAVTLLNNRNDLIPFHLTDTIEFASLSLYTSDKTDFVRKVGKYAVTDHYSFKKNQLSPFDYEELMKKLSRYEVVLVSLHDLNNNPRQAYGLSQQDIQFINALNKRTHLILIVYGNPYCLKYFEDCSGLVCAYEDNRYAQETVAQQLFGAIPIRGKMPVTASDRLILGAGIDRDPIGRLGYSSPSREKFNMNILSLVDTIVEDAIEDNMSPGIQLLIARNGRIVMDKNYGHTTYDMDKPVSDSTLYDLASVTKVAGTTQILMMLVEHGFIDLDKKASFYLPELKGTNKEDIIIRDILTHQAGLLPYYPFWIHTTNDRNGKSPYYNSSATSDFTIELTPGMYVRPELKDTVWNWMVQSDVIEKKDPRKPYEYVYSDIGFYIIQRLIERVTYNALDDFLEEYLYTPLGVKHITYHPRKFFPIEQIAPSEVDNTFRKSVIQGNVHDEIASIYGGVAGHAGLFSNAHSLAVIMQMNLQKGYYGGTQYIGPEVMDQFTTRQYRYNRRGLGWDKPQIIGYEYNPASFYASANSYGHSGFTGTYVWVDPEYNLIFIFLSNRTFPDAGNKKLIDQEVRKRIQTVIYSSLIYH